MDHHTPDKDEIFNAAAEMTDDVQRRRFLDQACGDDLDLRAEIEELLAHDGLADSLLDRTAAGIGRTIGLTIAEKPGTHIGSYKLLQQIGEGGMGAVFMAEQTRPIERRVAVKIIKPGMDTRQVIARFEAERQALAMMDHPNIAKVFDAGTTETGRPFFVMELVKGVPITQYCDQYRLTVQQRLQLFVPVCQAVQHAHQKGIIHRDLKPSNVLVARFDGEPIPKVIDFGVSKATGRRLTDKTMFTEFGQVVGTIEYMSPEQAEFNQADIDTRSDIFSLGVLLYELLTGQTPFDGQRLRSAAFDEMLRIIREEEPPRPSTKLSSSETLPNAAANRGVEPGKLARVVRNELDWIVMKSLDKDRNQRYETAASFADDICRYLNDESVEARPHSTAYRLFKFAKRNKLAIGTGSTVVLALVLGSVVALWQSVRARNAEREAIAQAALATESERNAKLAAEKAIAESQRASVAAAATEDVNAFVIELLDAAMSASESGSSPQEDPKLQQVIDRAARQLQRRFADQPLVKARLCHLMWLALGNLGDADRARQFKHESFDLLDRGKEQLVSQEHALGPDHETTLRTRLRLSNVLVQWTWSLSTINDLSRRDPDKSLELAQEAVSLNGTPNDYANLAVAQYRCHEFAAAVETFERLDALTEDHDRIHRMFYAMALWQLGRREEALRKYGEGATLTSRWGGQKEQIRFRGEAEDVLGIDERQRNRLVAHYYSAQPPTDATFEYWFGRGEYHRRLGSFEMSVVDFTKALELGPEHRITLMARGQALENLGRYEEALKDLDACLDEAYGTSSSLWAYIARSNCNRVLGHLDAARTDAERAVAIDGESHFGWEALTRICAAQGDTERAALATAYSLFGRKKLDELRKVDDRPPLVLVAEHFSGPELENKDVEYWRRRGRWHKQRKEFKQVLEDFSRVLDLVPGDAEALGAIGWRLTFDGRHKEAIDYLNRALEFSPNYWSLSARANANRQLGNLDAALRDARSAVKLNSNHPTGQVELAASLASQEEWRIAARTLKKVVDQNPDEPKFWRFYTYSLLASDQQEVYRTFCDDLLVRFGETEDGSKLAGLIMCVNQEPTVFADRSAHQKISQQAFADGVISSLVYAQTLLGDGEFAQAIELIRERKSEEGRDASVSELLPLAEGYFKLGKLDQSEHYLEAAKSMTGAGNWIRAYRIRRLEDLIRIAGTSAESVRDQSQAEAEQNQN